MSSIPSEISFRPRSLSGVRDVIESCECSSVHLTTGGSGSLSTDRRAQGYLSDSVSASGTSDDEEPLEEPTIEEEQDMEGEAAREEGQPYDALVNNLQWDEDLTPSLSAVPSRRPFLLPRRISQATATVAGMPSMAAPKAEERTPLLRAPMDVTYLRHTETVPTTVSALVNGDVAVERAMSRRPSQMSVRRTVRRTAGKAKVISGNSTYGQTVRIYWLDRAWVLTIKSTPAFQRHRNPLGHRNAFRALGICIRGMDRRDGNHYVLWLDHLLHVSVRDAHSRTIVRLITVSAKILAHIILDDPGLRSYSDIGKKAFGPRSGPWISAVFCLELFTVR